MQPRLVNTEQAQYVAGEWNGKNESGREPIGDFVLVRPDLAADTLGAAGVILSAEETKMRMSMAAETGVIVAVAEGAFQWSADRTRPFEGRKPQPGDRVDFARYSGRIIKGADGVTYRLMADNSIASVWTAEASTEAA